MVTITHAMLFLICSALIHGILFSMQVMLLGFVLLGRSLEERARLSASSDMNELLVNFYFLKIFPLKFI